MERALSDGMLNVLKGGWNLQVVGGITEVDPFNYCEPQG